MINSKGPGTRHSWTNRQNITRVSKLCKIQSKLVTVPMLITVSWDLTPNSLVVPVGVAGVGKQLQDYTA